MNPLDKIFAGLGALVVTFVLGLMLMHSHMQDKINTLKATYATELQLSQDAKAAAEQRATNTERGQKAAIADALSTYQKDRQNEKAHDDAVIADLRTGAQRLRVSTNRPACGGALPGPAASGPGTPDVGSETLAGPVAARLAGRYADYNRIVDKLTACQAVIAADRLQPN